jgi:hypothetical protein
MCAVVRLRALMARQLARLITNPPIRAAVFFNLSNESRKKPTAILKRDLQRRTVRAEERRPPPDGRGGPRDRRQRTQEQGQHARKSGPVIHLSTISIPVGLSKKFAW